MPYIGQPPVTGDTTKSFRLLDNLASFTLTFDATSSSVVDTSANTLTFANHRFVTAQRVTYTDGGGTAIGGLTDGTAYFIIKVDQNTIQLASSASNANNSTAISLSSGAAGGSHTLNLAFDGTNTKFKATYGNGTKAKISRAGQLLISINGVLQQAQESSTPTLGFGLDSDSTIVFSQAPVSTDVLFGQILADTITNFDTQDNTLDVFTGDGSTTAFTLSKKPASSNDILVTLDGVVQYPTTTSTSNAYSVSDNTLSFTAAPADGVAIQVRHIGFAGATSSAVTGLYGRTGNVTLSSSDDDITVGNVTAGIITATSYGSISGTTASFSGNVSVGGTLTYEDVTNIDAVGLITARKGIKVDDLGVQVGTGATVDSAGNNILTFLTNGSERLRITSDGDVGIGDNAPNSNYGTNLSVHSTATDGARLKISDGSTGKGNTDGLDIISTGSVAYFINRENAHMSFSTNDTERLRIDSSGRLLLGTTTEGVAQSDDLTVATSGDTGITVRSGTSSNGNLFFSDGTSGTDEYRGYVQYDHSANELIFGSDATARMRIDSSGNIGIGIDSPASILHIKKNSSNTSPTSHNFPATQSGLFVDNQNTGTNGTFSAVTLRAYNSGSTAQSASIIAQSTSSGFSPSLLFMQRSGSGTQAERMRIDSSGNLGIGESSPDTTLHIDSGSTPTTLKISSNTESSIDFEDKGGSAKRYKIGTNITSNDGQFEFKDMTANVERMRITSDGNVRIGSTAGGTQPLCIAGSDSSGVNLQFQNSTTGNNSNDGVLIGLSGGEDGQFWNYENNNLLFGTNNTESMRVDNGGRLLIGTTSSRSPGGIEASFQVEGTGAADSSITMVRNSNDVNPAYLILGKSRGTSNGSNTIVADDDNIGSIQWAAADGTDIGSTAAYITCAVDGGPGANDMPGRLLFGTTPNGSNSPVTRLRITENGFTKITSNNNYVNVNGLYHELNSHISNAQNLIIESSNSSYASVAVDINVVRSSTSAYSFLRGVSGNFADTEFNLRGDGNGYADGTWSGGGADYAEYFEWSDGNTGAEDRRGISVVLVGDKIREAVAGEEPIGVISGNPSVVGDADYDRWKDKYLRDDYGTYIQENYEVEDDDGNTIVQQRRQLNPNYNPDTTYVSREDRTEWDTVGLMGKLRIRKGQVTGARWIKMRDINDNVEEWLVRQVDK